MTRSPSPSSTHAPQGRGVAGAAHLVAGAPERLRQNGADRAVVIGTQNWARSLIGVFLGHDRKVQAEFSAARAAVDLDQAAMVADNLGDQRQTEAAAGQSWS